MRSLSLRRRWLPLWALVPGAALAHVADGPPAAGMAALTWSADPLVISLLVIGGLLYGVGHAKLRMRSQLGRRTRALQGTAFAGGCLTLVVALVSPLDALGGVLFSAHMLQHELLMIVAAPLLVLGRPLAVWLWAFGPRARAAIARAVRARAPAAAWRWLTSPTVAWALHAVAVWAWHVPRLFEAALHHPAVHTLQHWSFLLSALLFWWTVLGVHRVGQAGAHPMLSLFTTMVHTGALGALLTLAPVIWYPSYAEATAWGFDPLDDQRIGGLVMWVPGGMAYVFGGLAVAARWLARRQAPGSPEIIARP
ncbi:cytochrome c oxidase assembly protein [Variovorax sp. J22P271]|uniref:cytochrome c oxidase assembly protein n=1 Tax=Variovorax davisae TaxID=3053515 RepID=UPI0025790FD5|nr:cytochrome c oxidase assembly protein [Variovorax sp. J22P271]MDM0032129.1 cytochrome c oxidase assembly protein [Variovorax sp. J22P271]